MKSPSTAANAKAPSSSNPSRDELLAVESHKQWLAHNTSSVGKASTNPGGIKNSIPNLSSTTNAQGTVALDTNASQSASKQVKQNTKKVNKPTLEPKSADAKVGLGLLQGMKLSTLMKSLDSTGMYKLDESAKEQVIELANDFINVLTHQSLKLSKHRIKMQELQQHKFDENDNRDKWEKNSTLPLDRQKHQVNDKKVVNVYDVALVLRKNWGITIQGLSGLERNRKANLTRSRVVSVALRNQAAINVLSTSEGRSSSGTKARGGKSTALGKRKRPGNSRTITDVVAGSTLVKKSHTGNLAS